MKLTAESFDSNHYKVEITDGEKPYYWDVLEIETPIITKIFSQWKDDVLTVCEVDEFIETLKTYSQFKGRACYG